jgi:UDP-N-acetyl-3-dehydro-alpha-D-glucosamine 3-aminotranferase
VTVPPVPQFDLTRQYAAIEPEIEAALRRVLRGGQFILGAEGEAFEAECAAALGVGHAIAVGSGTDALQLGLAALGVGPGDEVVTPAFSFVASATAVLHLGATPVFADVDPVTLTLGPEQAAAAITPRTRVIVAVHLYGLPAPMPALQRLAEARGLVVLEDMAQAFGAAIDSRPVGSFGRAAALSFYPTKPLGAYGDAGLVATGDGALAEAVRRHRHHGQVGKYHHVELGGNSRLDELQAAILRVKLRHAAAWTEARRGIAARYTAALRGLPLGLPAEPAGTRHVFHQYTIRTPRRDALAKHLAGAGIGTACHYPQPIPGQPLFRALGWDPARFPVAWAAAQEVLSLPCFPELREAEVGAVIDQVHEFFRGEPECEC